MSFMQQAVREWAWVVGAEVPDRQWLMIRGNATRTIAGPIRVIQKKRSRRTTKPQPSECLSAP